jgi:hypothetical protein
MVGFLSIIIPLLFVGVLMGVVSFVSTWSRSYRVRVRDTHINKGYVTDYWVLPKKEKDTGVIWWRSVWWQKKFKLPEPPQEVVDIGLKGRKYVEVWRLSEDEYVFGRDKGITEESILTETGHKLGELFNAFSVVQRQVVVDQFVKAEAEKHHSWLKENGMNLAFGGMMTIIIVIGLIYWGDIGQSMIEQQKASSGFLHEANKVLQDMKGVGSVTPSGSGGIVTSSETPPKPPDEK